MFPSAYSTTRSTSILVKVKCTLVQALRLCTGRTAHRGSRGIALPFLDHGTRRGWGVSLTPRPIFTPVPMVQVAGWASGPVWTGAENLAPTGIRSPGCPARSQSLYWLRYRTHNCRETRSTKNLYLKYTNVKNNGGHKTSQDVFVLHIDVRLFLRKYRFLPCVSKLTL